MPDQIFISYRRDDAAYVTGHINDLLRKEFGDEAVFTDVDNIALGVDFRVVIDSTVSQCQVFLAVIGSGWLGARDQEGNQRLQDPADFVRIEIESALKRNIPVIPLLVAGATMPAPEDLPESLRNLAYRNGTPIRPAPDFTADMARLIKNLRLHFDKMRASQGDKPAAKTRTAPVAPKTGKSGPPQQDEAPGEKMHVAADERARKQAELGIGRQKKRRWTAPLWLAAIVIGAVGGWFFVDRNPQLLEEILAGSPLADSTTDADVDAIDSGPPDSSIGIGGTPETADAPAPNLLPDTSTVTSEGPATADGAAPRDADANTIPDAVQSVADVAGAAVAAGTSAAAEELAETSGNLAVTVESATSNAAITAPDTVETVPVEASEQLADTEEGVDDAASASATSDDVAADPDAAGEVVLTPGSQRQSEASTLISDGVRLAGVGEHEEAIQNFSDAIPLDVEPAFVYKQRGASYQALGQFEAAIADYDQAIQLNNEDPTNFYNRGIAHYALQNYAAAIADFDAVIQFDPEFVDAYSRRADAHEAAGNIEAATRDRAVVSVFESNRDDPR